MSRSDERLGVGLVFGASSGIGAAVVHRLAGRTDRLYAASRRGTLPGGEPSHCPTVRAVRCDVRSYPQVAEVLEAVQGDLTFVVNCAGVGFYAPLDGDHSAAWQEIVDTNLIGLANILAGVRAVRPGLDTLVQISSLAAHRASRTPGNAMYTATKTAARVLLEDYRRLLRADGHHTRVLAISPGFVAGTEFGEHYFRYTPQAATDIYAGQRSLHPDDVAALVEASLTAPSAVEITDLMVRPRSQPD